MIRKLASIQKIADLQPIEGADRIEKATVNGWDVVVEKGLHEVGDNVVYCEIDSWMPHELAPFLSKGKEPREFQGIKGERIRTIKLRGQVSQGLILPLSAVPQLKSKMDLSVGDDVTDILGIVKWEKPIPAQLQGQAKGSFPSFIKKTDQERVQNLISKTDFFEGEWEVTLKLDGSSMTIYTREGEVGVCSRNLELKDNEDNQNNSFVKMANAMKYKSVLPVLREEVGFDFAIQGELMGEGIQGNREKISGHEFFIFDVYNIDDSRYLLPNERYDFLKALMAVYNETGGQTPLHVPIIGTMQLIDVSMDMFLDFADQSSMVHNIAEGVVFKSMTDSRSFKVINNKFLLKGGE